MFPVSFLFQMVAASLLEKYKIDPTQIGHLKVGSKRVIDKDKSIETFLMQVFEVYVEGPAWSAGGTAAVTMLIGPNASSSLRLLMVSCEKLVISWHLICTTGISVRKIEGQTIFNFRC
ncbi:hypothetical protein SLEP1_g3552 [Rubroshorea leprosula]|uniref:Hydroxymethylglutaryl-coenzyme A synthase N-terminal domain-containing protein n=1 Tax=Rubroshorea leprosula TaxID=152421 RepID=A0AAV5HV44_9ROSI|nr:hypothetical protein SLEP1_g3552 [Rubroshorea leprosula]